MTPAGFPHSDIRGSQGACPSPRLIAACHVLHRLPAPRHPPCALTALGQLSPQNQARSLATTNPSRNKSPPHRNTPNLKRSLSRSTRHQQPTTPRRTRHATSTGPPKDPLSTHSVNHRLRHSSRQRHQAAHVGAEQINIAVGPHPVNPAAPLRKAAGGYRFYDRNEWRRAVYDNGACRDGQLHGRRPGPMPCRPGRARRKG
jgi:hypothetical protein